MQQIPSDIIAQLLDLRRANGLEATEAAIYSDLEKSKCKWTLSDTPRYRRAGQSPLWVSGKYLSSYGTCPASGEADQGRSVKPLRVPKAAPRPVVSVASKIDEGAFYKVLHGKGFPVKITQDLLTGEIQTQLPDAVRKLELNFSAIPSNASSLHVIQTSPQIQIAMSLDKFLELAGIRA
ncbi:MAG: hypothetical protein EAZ65_08885 [Verrucomicrobia bacterium]|nr:MAG: hypothetical protein EAZ84_07890 [Verrucomicrobiota bacterium]TAE86158.1 MAG: hypothetical protein EAZ82_11935 [Verrucomicrobiota bacterium]TAF23505.1 MAG: hypothetical protein EAZ71_12515 [Verrucomicrobiota bacterium]TAF40133.1 MAG: hypothetical protein EAZ65_08885 [Verrucomicrobiota bacterium]